MKWKSIMVEKEKVKIVRLITGEDILCVVESESTSDFIKISDPFRIVIIPTRVQGETPTVGLNPWSMFSVDKTFNINKDLVLTISTPDKQFVEQYASMLSPIITKPNLILPGL